MNSWMVCRAEPEGVSMHYLRSTGRHLYRGLALAITFLLVLHTTSSGEVSTSRPGAQAPAPAEKFVPSFPLVEVPMPSRIHPGQDRLASRGVRSQPDTVQAASTCASVTIGLKVLVIVAEPTDTLTALPAIRQVLDYQGTPYTV